MTNMVASLEVGICCEDIDPLVVFYREILEAELIGVLDVSAQKAREAEVGACGYRVARVQLPTGERLKFLQPERAAVRSASSGEILDSLGIAYLTFIVDDLDRILANLVRNGAKIATGSRPVEIRPGVAIVLAHDPEGNFIEFVHHADLAAYRATPSSQYA